MASRAGQRRTTPGTISPHPKPGLSVEDWEAKAPLGDIETRSVSLLKIASEKTPLPLQFSTDDSVSSSRPSTPNMLRGGISNRLVASRPSTPVPTSARSLASNNHPLHPTHPVQTPQQFYDWFALIDRSVAHSQESHFRAHVASVADHLDTCDQLVDKIDVMDGEVDSMLEGWKGVEEGGKSLKDACERLLEERDRLLEITDEIGARLEYFQELEQATRMLNHPGESLVMQTDFLYMVERVDICIDYLRAHRQFREAEIYLLRFQQCMTRAMTLIKMFFVGSLRALTADVSKRLSERDVSSTAQMHLLYTRFRSISTQLAPLLGELERRVQAHPEELSALLAECHSAYFAARKTLLTSRLMEEIRGLDPTRTELVELTRAGCSYLKQLCTDEFNIYREFFNSGEDQLYAYLENMCDYLYDDLRPRILHEPRLTALCEVCTVLQALMVLDVPSLEDDDDDVDQAVDIYNRNPSTRQKGLSRLHISHLLQMVLQDAQTRLFFKAQAVIQSDIRYYIPLPGDLAYPDKLVDAQKPKSGLEIKEKEIVSQIFHMPSLAKQETWYPTLEKTVWVLSQLHDFVKPAIFEDIAQEAVSLCRQSLVAASNLIKTRQPPHSILDGQLFLVRHLLILKEVAHNLDLVQRDVHLDIDLAGVTDTLASMLNRTTALLPDALFASLGMPRAPESIKEAKHGIDSDLKQVCEDVIFNCANPICEPLRTWARRVKDHDSGKDAEPLTSQPWAQQSAAEALDVQFRQACERDLRSSVVRLRMYLEDDRTVRVLVDHVKDGILDEYAGFSDVVRGLYAGGMAGALLSPGELRDILHEVCKTQTSLAVVSTSV